jgi:hypothetical protein
MDEKCDDDCRWVFDDGFGELGKVEPEIVELGAFSPDERKEAFLRLMERDAKREPLDHPEEPLSHEKWYQLYSQFRREEEKSNPEKRYAEKLLVVYYQSKREAQLMFENIELPDGVGVVYLHTSTGPTRIEVIDLRDEK